MIERPLIISPTLAATLGLNEALLYQLLQEWSQLQSKADDAWLLIDKDHLLQLLPFWQWPEIEKSLQNLQMQGMLELGSSLSANVRNLRISLTSTKSPVSKPSTTVKTPQRAGATANPMQTPAFNTTAGPIVGNWQPDAESLKYLQQFHGIPQAFIEGVLPEFIAFWRDRGEARSSWNSLFSKHVSKQWKQHQQEQSESSRKFTMHTDWRPDAEAVQILERADIEREFIEEAIPEFILYWRENGRQDNQWNTRFVEHVRRQWAHYSNAIAFDTEPRQIPSNWQPDEAVFDILRMANIDLEFARQLLPEFILYWQDSRQLNRSWNSKFLQHIKYQWAQRHKMGDSYAGWQNPDGKPPSEAEKLFEKLTDRSWASQLLDKPGSESGH